MRSEEGDTPREAELKVERVGEGRRDDGSVGAGVGNAGGLGRAAAMGDFDLRRNKHQSS